MIAITIEININDEIFSFNNKSTKLNAGALMQKYNLSIVENSTNEIINKFVDEIKANDNILIGYACNTFEEISYLNNELKKYNLSLDTVYIPSEERINSRVQKAIEEQRRWGYREGVSDEEIEQNFKNFRSILQAIRDGLKNTFIKVKEV